MFSVITNIYNKKTKGPTLMGFSTATGKLKKYFFLTTRYVRCVNHGWHGTHWHYIHVLATHASTCWYVCDKNKNIVSMCAVSLVVLTSNIPSCKKKKFSFLVDVKNSIKIGPLVFLFMNVCNHGEHYETTCTRHHIPGNTILLVCSHKT